MNFDAGGAQTFVASLAMEQKGLGHDVSIIVIDELINSDFQTQLVSGLREKSVNLIFSKSQARQKHYYNQHHQRYNKNPIGSGT